MKSHIQAVPYQIVPHSRRSINFFHLYENPIVLLIYLTYYLISSDLFQCLLRLDFECWITFQLCQFRCNYATVHALHNFSSVFADWCFSWLYLKFHWLSFYGVFSRCILGLRKKGTGKKASVKNNFSNLDNSFRKMEWFVYTHVFGRFFLGCFFWEIICRTFFSFMMMFFFEILSKAFYQ